MAYQPGDRIGDYEVVSVLGAGGMGKVYKVRNVISDRLEAMKVLLPDFQENPDLADRFMREIKMQGSMSHPNIAQLHTAMRHNNELLMLMEFVDGTPADEKMKWGPVPPAMAASYAIQVLQALSYAHARGVIHRDIKPANIMVGNDGKVKLLDFGIARMKADKRLTQTGMTLGSLYYMSPEQISGGEVDGRSDIYALGITLYEMVTGKRPFEANSDFSLMAAHLNQDPIPPIQVDPTLPQTLNDIILMATSRDPGKRFQSAEAFGVALSNMTREPGIGTASFGSPQRPVFEDLPPTTPPPLKSAPPIPAAPLHAPTIAMPTNAVVAQAKSGRGLYMALGSVVTVAVIVFAAMQMPKWFGAKADQSAVVTQLVTPAQTQAGIVQPAATVDPAATTTVQTATTDPAATSPAQAQTQAQTQVQAVDTRTVPVPSQRAASQTTSSQPITSQPVTTQAVTTQPIKASPITTQPVTTQPITTQPVANQPVASQQIASQPITTQPVVNQPITAPPTIPPGNATDLNAIRDRFMKLAARVGAVQTKARAMESTMRSQGLGMRSDVISGVSRMTHYMEETENALRDNNAEAARAALRRADQETDTLERILGII